MRISAYARATNPKYANFAPIDWSQLAGQLGTKARGALSTPVGAAKLGAGIGAGIGAINYLGSDDKSIGNLAGQVGGGAALGGAAGYGGSRLKNAWQARKAGNQALLPATTNASATNVTQTPINNQPFTPKAPKQQAQLPAAKPVSRPESTQNGVITTPASVEDVTQDFVNKTRKNAKQNYEQNGIPDLSRAEADGVLPLDNRFGRGAKPMKSANTSMNTSPFANFKVRRYNGFVY
jgi:hypothetical protein